MWGLKCRLKTSFCRGTLHNCTILNHKIPICRILLVFCNLLQENLYCNSIYFLLLVPCFYLIVLKNVESVVSITFTFIIQHMFIIHNTIHSITVIVLNEINIIINFWLDISEFHDTSQNHPLSFRCQYLDMISLDK